MTRPSPPTLASTVAFCALMTLAHPLGAASVAITKADCARLVKHVPAPDVAYRPGVDVYGNPVAPADLYDGDRLMLPDEILIEIEVDLFVRFGIPANGVSYDGDAIIGVVRYAEDHFTFNGQPLQSEEEAALAAGCQAIEGTTP